MIYFSLSEADAVLYAGGHCTRQPITPALPRARRGLRAIPQGASCCLPWSEMLPSLCCFWAPHSSIMRGLGGCIPVTCAEGERQEHPMAACWGREKTTQRQQGLSHKMVAGWYLRASALRPAWARGDFSMSRGQACAHEVGQPPGTRS